MLHVHRAERSDRLVAALADVLIDPLEDPLATEVVAVHSRGIERWIAQELSSRLGTGPLGGDGVCANLDFPFPGRLIRSAVAAGSGIDPEHDPWLPERLTWPLLALVDDDPHAPMLGPLRAHVGAAPGEDPDRLSRRFGAVRHIADLFDRYGVHRPGMVQRWRSGEPSGPDGAPLAPRHRWQPELWQAVRDRIDLPSFAERHDAALTRIREDPAALDALGLPPRLALFGLTALPASYLEVLAAIAVHRDVHLLLLHPSAALWDRVAAHTEADAGQHLWRRDQDPTAAVPRNPLLRSWGRDARELQLVAPLPADPDLRRHHPTAPTAEAPPASLLARIQADVRADRAPGGDEARPVLPPDDRSIQVHDCHGRLRQVEVLRDAIYHLLAERDGLEPRDIIVMCPDIEAFAPLITAVFGAEAVAHDGTAGPPAPGTPPALRVRLADRSLRRTNPVLEVVALLLDLVDERATASAVLDLLSREPVRRRFRIDEEELETLEDWITDLQIRWGLDAEHRRQHGLPELDANTWRAGLERLALGIAMADEDLRLVHGVAPYDGVEGHSADLAGRLTELIARLDQALTSMRGPRPVEAWRAAIGAAADALTATDVRTSWQRLQLHALLDELVGQATTDGETSPVALTLAEVQSLLAERLAGRPTTTGHRTGDLTVCTLVPMRSVPHRVVCLLGLDDGAFPRQSVPDADDLLLLAPRVGDRDPRSEDRQLLLDALLAATETLVITYAGRDERTNEDRPPAVPVDELLDVIDHTVAPYGDARRARANVTIRHPLAEHDPRNFAPGGLRAGGVREDDPPWGFRPETLEAARAHRATPAPPRPFLAAPLPLPDEDVIDLDDLVAFLQHPVKAFVRQRLEVRLPSEEDQRSDAIPATLKGLDAWKVGDPLVQAWLAGQDLERAVEVLRARGLIPPADLAAEDLAAVRQRVEGIIDLCGHIEVEPGTRRTVDIELELPDGRRLTGTVPDVHGWRVEAISYSRVAAKHRLATWARFLAVSAQTPDRPWSAATVGRHPYSRSKVAQAIVLAGLPGDAQDVRAGATTRLQRLVELYDRGRRAPLPLYCDTSAKIAANLHGDQDPTRYVDKAWETGPYAPFANEDLDPYHLLALGGRVPTEQLFAAVCQDPQEASWADDDRRVVAYAWRLWEPVLAAERRRER